jgi:glutamyl-tRNA synthetase/glutamyl-Q tRNA(Asp) synthetase
LARLPWEHHQLASANLQLRRASKRRPNAHGDRSTPARLSRGVFAIRRPAFEPQCCGAGGPVVSRPDLRAAAMRFGAPPRTRFAPSPTGYLHLGHVANAIYVWGVARALGARVRLRIEDHDRIRSRPQYEAAIVDDLDWLGFEPDEGRRPVQRQSDHPAVYEEALTRLRQTAHVYACDCSRKDIGSERYAGHCRERGLEPIPGRGIRVALDEEPETFDDLLLGRIVQTPAHQCGDLLLKDRDNNWTYQFAVTLDDMREDISLVIRGTDLLSSTARQIKLSRLLGRLTPPLFLHHPLILKAGGEKLSKAAGDVGVRELRRSGVSSAHVIGRAASAIGLLERPRPLTVAELPDIFRPEDEAG